MLARSGIYPIDRNSYAIIDLAALPEGELHSEIKVQVLVPNLMAADAKKMPGLVWLPGLSEVARALLSENLESAFRGEKQHLLSCLLHVGDSSDPISIGKHLARHLIIDSPQGKALLRFYDPRVFRHLEWIFSSSQLQSLFGKINNWSVCEPEKLRSVARPNSIGKSNWYASDEQRRILDRVGNINETLKRTQKHSSNFKSTSGKSIESIARRILAAMDCASQHYGLEHENDLVTFAEHSLLYGENFHEEKLFQNILTTLSEEECTYVDAIAQIEPEHLERLFRN